MLDCEPVKRLSIKLLKAQFLSDPVINLNNKRLHHAHLPFYSCCFLIQCRTEHVKQSGDEFVLKRPGHRCVCMPGKSACPQIHHAHLNHDLPNKLLHWPQACGLTLLTLPWPHALSSQQSCSKRKTPLAHFVHFQATMHLGLVSPVNTPHQCGGVFLDRKQQNWVFFFSQHA